MAISLLNPGSDLATVTIDWSMLGLKGKQKARDLWRQKGLGVYSGSFAAEVNTHGVVPVRLFTVVAPEGKTQPER